jgi:hypothetical protein
MMITPNGRFATNTRICMSMSDFHPVRRRALVFLLWNGRRCVVFTCTNACCNGSGCAGVLELHVVGLIDPYWSSVVHGRDVKNCRVHRDDSTSPNYRSKHECPFAGRKRSHSPFLWRFLSSVAVCLGLAARIASRLWQRSVHLRWLPAWAGAFTVTTGCTETGVRKGLVPC